jgi:hypothetical protein
MGNASVFMAITIGSGFTRRARIWVKGDARRFRILKGSLKEVLSSLDHSFSTTFLPLKAAIRAPNSSRDNIFEELTAKLPGVPLVMLRCFETDKNCAAYVPSGSPRDITVSPLGEHQVR